MKNPPIWNELAQLYDEKYEVLEKARIGYMAAIEAILKSIDDHLQSDNSDDEIKHASSTAIYPIADTHPSADLRKSLQYTIPYQSSKPVLTVIIRFGTPWQSTQAGHLEIALKSMDLDWARMFNDRLDHEKDVKEQNSNQCSEPHFIAFKKVLLSNSAFITEATLIVKEHIKTGVRISNDISRMERILSQCHAQLKADLKNRGEFELTEVSDWETPTCRYLQLNRKPEYSGFFVAYDAKIKLLILCYNGAVIDKQSKLKATLQGKIDAREWKEYSPKCGTKSDGGTIMDEFQIAKATDLEVVALIMKAFEIFLEVFETNPPLNK